MAALERAIPPARACRARLLRGKMAKVIRSKAAFVVIDFCEARCTFDKAAPPLSPSGREKAFLLFMSLSHILPNTTY